MDVPLELFIIMLLGRGALTHTNVAKDNLSSYFSFKDDLEQNKTSRLQNLQILWILTLTYYTYCTNLCTSVQNYFVVI